MSPRDPIVDDPEAVVINDRRRLDPETGKVRAFAQAPRSGSVQDPAPETVIGEVLDAEVVTEDVAEAVTEAVTDPVAELTGDLQRVTAEYANYRKRVERDRITVVEMATAGLLSGLLPVLDDLERARQHGDLVGALKGVADQLDALTGKFGLEQFGAAGEPFDPSIHEALMQAEPDPSQTVATCAAVLQPGYRTAGSGSSGGRVLRPARVSVAEPGSEPPAPAAPPVPGQ